MSKENIEIRKVAMQISQRRGFWNWISGTINVLTRPCFVEGTARRPKVKSSFYILKFSFIDLFVLIYLHMFVFLW